MVLLESVQESDTCFSGTTNSTDKHEHGKWLTMNDRLGGCPYE